MHDESDSLELRILRFHLKMGSFVLLLTSTFFCCLVLWLVVFLCLLVKWGDGGHPSSLVIDEDRLPLIVMHKPRK